MNDVGTFTDEQEDARIKLMQAFNHARATGLDKEYLINLASIIIDTLE